MRRLAARLVDEPTSYSASSRPVAPAPRAAGSRLSIDQVQVKDVKWLWEPDEGGSRWVPYDAPLCQKLERHFQLWLFAKTTTCRVCEARRATFPYDAATIDSSFVHAFRPDVMWNFRFLCQNGNALHVQVLLAM